MKDYKPAYHYRPRANWINDPCGLIHHQGVYHLFHQYNPHGDQWGDMHWGHATSANLVDWQEQPIAMAPALEKGENHCFTGSAGRLPDGSPVIFYTSISDKREPEQWMALPEGDGLSSLRQTDRCALKLDMHPNGMDVSEWRDPSILPYGDGYLMVLGCRLKDHGAALLYTSKDGQHYTYHSVLAESDGGEDHSWECPNFFRVGDRFVLMYSPYRQPRYLVGRLTEDLRFLVEGRGIIDESGQEGAYAPQSFRDEGGRQLLISWLTERSRGAWPGLEGWAGCMGLPKEVYIQGGVVKLRTVPEVEKLAVSSVSCALPAARMEAGEQYRLTVDASLAPDGMVEAELLATADGAEKTCVRVYGNGRLVVDRGMSSLHATHHSLLERRIALPEGKLHLEVYVDHSVLEVGGNDEWISTRVYPAGDDCHGLALRCHRAKGQCTVTQMRSCEK